MFSWFVINDWTDDYSFNWQDDSYDIDGTEIIYALFLSLLVPIDMLKSACVSSSEKTDFSYFFYCSIRVVGLNLTLSCFICFSFNFSINSIFLLQLFMIERCLSITLRTLFDSSSSY